MGLLEQIQKDAAKIVSNANDFGVAMKFTDGAYEEANVIGIYSKHHTQISTDGSAINSKTCSVCVAESKLLAEGYAVRNDDGEVDMDGHLVQFIDSTGVLSLYKIIEQFPDETLGLLTFRLTDYATN